MGENVGGGLKDKQTNSTETINNKTNSGTNVQMTQMVETNMTPNIDELVQDIFGWQYIVPN